VHELALIGELSYAPYFLTVYDIVRFARSRAILCQGRGSAANSAVCYCLGITAVDPSRLDLLFERFISAERNEPPDIDVDFEHERREEVIQYIYEKYGRHRAGIAATVIRYRSKSAIRDVGKALGLSLDMVGLLASNVWGWRNDDAGEDKLDEIGLDRGDANLMLAIELANHIRGFPRHLSQHVGGFIITDGPLSELVPIENAAMADRTFIEWDKDDLDALGILKIDVLALGMLTCIRKCFDLIEAHHGKRYTLATVPAEQAGVYDMLCLGDSIGVFQVESRAQMTMLPRLRPRDFYDLVIEVAIVRPGPIQGDMVHPYLRRRAGEERVEYPSAALEKVLGKTLGVPLFQEQAMQIAIVAAGFTPSEADQLRRAMATFRRTGTIQNFHDKMINGMVERGYEQDFAERCFRQIEGFGEYGFPESHAASFALLVYVSAWLKRYYPAAFACGLLNSQPMGFYAPAQIVRDAVEHGVTVLPPDINASGWDSTLELTSSSRNSRQRISGISGRTEHNLSEIPARAPLGRNDDNVESNQIALRLGFRQIKGFKVTEAEKLVAARGLGYGELAAVWHRAGLTMKSLERLANADAWRSVNLDRRQALWALKGLKDAPLPLFAAAGEGAMQGQEPAATLPALRRGEHVTEDYVSLRLSLKEHPLVLLRRRLGRLGAVLNEELKVLKDGSRVTVAGLVLARQRPSTAKGIIFATLEDETGVANIVVWPDVFETYRRAVVGARLMVVKGELQREGIVIHVIAKEVIDLSGDLDQLANLDDPKDATALDSAEAPVNRARTSRHPRNVTLISQPPSPGQSRIKPKSRDFH
jgi:error-prone DNA polymerase